MRKLNNFTVLLVVLSIVSVLYAPVAAAAAVPEIESEAALIVESVSGRILHEKNRDTVISAGMAARLMTLLLAAEAIGDGRAGLTDPVAVSEAAAAAEEEGGGTLSLKAGEILSLEELLYAAYLGMSPGACRMIADHISGNGGLAGAMNDRAARLGCTNTRFSGDGGPAAPGQRTTVWDTHLIFKEAFRYPLLATIAGVPDYHIGETEHSAPRSLKNPNPLRSGGEHDSPFVLAGMSAVDADTAIRAAYAKNGDISLVAVAVGPSGEAGDLAGYGDLARLFDWAMESFSWQVVLEAHSVVAIEPVAYGKDRETVDLRPEHSVSIFAPNDLASWEVTRTIDVYDRPDGKPLAAPLRAGAVLGELTLYVEGDVCAQVSLVAAQAVELDQNRFIRQRLAETLSLTWVRLAMVFLTLVVAGYVWLVARDYRARLRRRRQVEETKEKLAEERRHSELYR